jgi:hypothetical protein
MGSRLDNDIKQVINSKKTGYCIDPGVKGDSFPYYLTNTCCWRLYDYFDAFSPTTLSATIQQSNELWQELA